MEQLKQTNGKYFLFGLPVEVKLIHGPVGCSYQIKYYSKTPIKELVNRIKQEEGIDISTKANAFLTTSIRLKDEFGDCMHEFVWFFFAKPQLN